MNQSEFDDLCTSFIECRDAEQPDEIYYNDQTFRTYLQSTNVPEMRKAHKIFKKKLPVERSELKTLTAEFKKLKTEQEKCEKLAKSSLVNMAANNVKRVGAPAEMHQKVRFSGYDFLDVDLLLDCATLRANSEPFNKVAKAFNEMAAAQEGVNSSNIDVADQDYGSTLTGDEDSIQQFDTDNKENEVWVCTEADTLLPEKDLLGMCPGAKQHMSDEQIKKLPEYDAKGKKVVKTCQCDHCKFTAQARGYDKSIEAQTKAVAKKRTDITTCNANKTEAWTLLKSVREEEEEGAFDPVFANCFNPDYSFSENNNLENIIVKDENIVNDENITNVQNSNERSSNSQISNFTAVSDRDETIENATLAHALSRIDDISSLSNSQVANLEASSREWERLRVSLSEDDIPLKICFLDKSGSMGCDQNTFDSLLLGLYNSLHPKRGSTLTFLLAARGDTQIILRRQNDAPIEEFHVELGASTWFNEPVVKTLRFLAPLIQKIDYSTFFRARGEPPIQVLCLTDGMDNQSKMRLRKFGPFVNAIKNIKGVNNSNVYMPLIPFENNNPAAIIASGKCPLWLCWIACGIGGMGMLNDGVLRVQNCSNTGQQNAQPRELLFIDAVATPALRDDEENWDYADLVDRRNADPANSTGEIEQYTDNINIEIDDNTMIPKSPDVEIPATNESLVREDPNHAGYIPQIEFSPLTTNISTNVRTNPLEPGQHHLTSTSAFNSRKRGNFKEVKRQAAQVVGRGCEKRDKNEWKAGHRGRIVTEEEGVENVLGSKKRSSGFAVIRPSKMNFVTVLRKLERSKSPQESVGSTSASSDPHGHNSANNMQVQNHIDESGLDNIRQLMTDPRHGLNLVESSQNNMKLPSHEECEKLVVLLDKTQEETIVSASELFGAPAKSVSMLRKQKLRASSKSMPGGGNNKRPSTGSNTSNTIAVTNSNATINSTKTPEPALFSGSTNCGILARRSDDPEQQARQVMAVVNAVSSDMASLFLSEKKSDFFTNGFSGVPSGRVFPLEAAVALVNGGSECVDKKHAAEMKAVLEDAQEMFAILPEGYYDADESVEEHENSDDEEDISEDEAVDVGSSENESHNILSSRDDPKTKFVASPIKKITRGNNNEKLNNPTLHSEKQADLLRQAFGTAGFSARKLSPDDRKMAQRLLSVGVELLFWGGSLQFSDYENTNICMNDNGRKNVSSYSYASTTGMLIDQLGDFAGVKFPRFPFETSHELDAWRAGIERPLHEVLKMLINLSILNVNDVGIDKTSTSGSFLSNDYRILTLSEPRRKDILLLWRFFDPNAQLAGSDDSLRLCVNRRDSLRGGISVTELDKFCQA